MNDTTEAMIALFAVLCLGLALGRISIGGVSLGTSGVLFVALAAGHFGFSIPRAAGDVGVVGFVYCLGIGAGPSFLRMFLQRGKALAFMAVLMISAAAAAAWALSSWLGISADLIAGLFAGADQHSGAGCGVRELAP